MVLLTAPYEQRSNQFFQHIHLDSFCRENHIPFYNDYLSKYYEDYPNLKSQCEKRLLKYILKAYFKLKLNSYEFDGKLSNEKYKSVILKAKILYCHGWYFRSYETTGKYRSLYQHLLDPAVNKRQLDQEWLQKSNDHEKVIGIHIRREDYKTWQNGIYFYEDDVYLQKINEISELLNHNCKFILFTNDSQLKVANYSGISKLAVSNNDVISDHYLMSKCNYIIGPPSTFSLWASYIGETLFYHIYDPKDRIEINQFKICDG